MSDLINILWQKSSLIWIDRQSDREWVSMGNSFGAHKTLNIERKEKGVKT